MSGKDAGGEPRGKFVVIEIVAEMCQEGFARGKASRNRAGFGDRKMGGVGRVTEGINDQEVEPGHEGERFLRHFFYIG